MSRSVTWPMAREQAWLRESYRSKLSIRPDAQLHIFKKPKGTAGCCMTHLHMSRTEALIVKTQKKKKKKKFEKETGLWLLCATGPASPFLLVAPPAAGDLCGFSNWPLSLPPGFLASSFLSTPRSIFCFHSGSVSPLHCNPFASHDSRLQLCVVCV